jgi:hypothetical protein
LLAFLGALAVPSIALAESADHYRGGWLAEDSGRIYQFVIRESEVTGYACTHCADGTTLAPLEGNFDPERGLIFTVRYLDPSGAEVTGLEHVEARLVDGKLELTGPRDGAGERVIRLAIKDPRGPDAAAFPIAILPPGATPPPILQRPAGPPPAPPPAPYEPPATWRQLGPSDIEGVWLGFGTGVNKQFFIIRRDGERLFGLACGRCDNPYTHGALENFRFEGDTVRFDIVHQDWGEGDRLPFTRHVAAKIALNELRMDARRDDAPDGPGIVASLYGPIPIEATRGNVTGE